MSKAVMAIVPVVLVAAVAGLGFTGVINIPGLTPKKVIKNANLAYAQADEKSVSKPTKALAQIPAKKEDPKPEKAVPKVAKKDPDQGADTLATVWNEIKTPELIKISANWKDDELAKVLGHMDNSLVAKFLDEMAKGGESKPNPVRASKLSKILQDQGSIIKLDAGSEQTP